MDGWCRDRVIGPSSGNHLFCCENTSRLQRPRFFDVCDDMAEIHRAMGAAASIWAGRDRGCLVRVARRDLTISHSSPTILPSAH